MSEPFPELVSHLIEAPDYTGQPSKIDYSKLPRFLGGSMENEEWFRLQKEWRESQGGGDAE